MPVVASISPLQTDAQAALRGFLLDLFPGASVVAAQSNRAPEPAGTNFIVMSPISFTREATNGDSSNDVKLAGSISGTVLSVNSVSFGQIISGLVLFGPGVAPGTTIVQQLSGLAGSTGTYQVSTAQTVAQATLSAGSTQMTATFFMTIQLDFHSADYTASAWAQTFAIAFRDNYATTFFAALAVPQNAISPLYTEDATQRPFINAEQQYEWRWVVDAKLQIDQTVTVPQTYSDSAAVTLYEVP